jgi:hypothetical protein
VNHLGGLEYLLQSSFGTRGDEGQPGADWERLYIVYLWAYCWMQSADFTLDQMSGLGPNQASAGRVPLRGVKPEARMP